MYKNYLVILLILIITFFKRNTLIAQTNADKTICNSIYQETIKTVLAYKEGWDMSYPVIDINSNDKIKISFDDLQDEAQDYSYEIIHCNVDWVPSDIEKSDYINGFFQNQITDYSYSVNTIIHYVHYNISFPNDDVSPLISGNYAIKVFQNNNVDDIVFTRRFYIVDYQTDIKVICKQAEDLDRYETAQELDFSIIYNNEEISNPLNNIKVKICQNYRWDNAITNLKPNFNNNNELIYKHQKESVFDGGNEFRNFNIKNIHYLSPHLKSVAYNVNGFKVVLHKDEERSFNPYFFDQDINGKYKVEIEKSENFETDADYLNVYFTLPYNAPFVNGNLYVCGALTDWQYSDRNKMTYDFVKKAYELNLLLKQGFYNYEYVFVDSKSQKADNALIEGNHFETENDYVFFVYYTDISERFDKLIGFKIANSLRKE